LFGEVALGDLEAHLISEVLVTLLDDLGDLRLELSEPRSLSLAGDPHPVLLLHTQLLEALLEHADSLLHLLLALFQACLVPDGVL
jgi:hypothetical protein